MPACPGIIAGLFLVYNLVHNNPDVESKSWVAQQPQDLMIWPKWIGMNTFSINEGIIEFSKRKKKKGKEKRSNQLLAERWVDVLDGRQVDPWGFSEVLRDSVYCVPTNWCCQVGGVIVHTFLSSQSFSDMYPKSNFLKEHGIGRH